MFKKAHLVLLGIIVALLVIIPVGLLISNMFLEKELETSTEENSSIFQTVSNLEALDLGLVDGDDLRQQNGIEASSESSGVVIKEDVLVFISLRSIQDDLKIKLSKNGSDTLISGVEFTVTVKGKDKTMTYSDTDKDGIIYISYVDSGDYTVFLSDISTDTANYHSDKSQTITVSDHIEYAKVDIKDEIKDESQINVAEDDTKVQDVDETTDISASSEGVADNGEVSESYDEDISDEAEDILSQIEAEDAANQASKAAYSGASSGTVTAPTIASDPQYVAAHSGVKGIDVSKHNGSIDWGAVKNAGINFAIIRCGYRGSTSGALVIDPLYYSNISGAQNAGINVGVYFFSQAVNEAEAVEEASMVLELISGYNLQMPVYMDVEASHGRGDQISGEERTAVVHAFLATIRNAGYTAGIYSNKKWFEEGRMNTASFTDYKIWLAQYVDIPTYTATRYDMWQYTSKGSVPGISGNVDMNVLK